MRSWEDLSVRQLLEDISSGSPTPGGGATAALVGSLAASLTIMVCNLTLGKDRYSSVEEEMSEILNEAEHLREKFLELAEEDTQAFQRVMKAYRRSRDTELERKRRSRAIEEALRGASEVPLEVMSSCGELMNIALRAAEKGNRNAVSDAACGFKMAKAAQESAVYNVKINIAEMNDAEFISQAKKKVNTAEKRCRRLSRRLEDVLSSRL